VLLTIIYSLLMTVLCIFKLFNACSMLFSTLHWESEENARLRSNRSHRST